MDDKGTRTANIRLFLNQVDALYANLGISALALPLLSSFLTWILWPVADTAVLLAWYGSALTLALAGGVLLFLYKRTLIHEHNARFWLNLHLTGILLGGLCWGSLLPLLVPAEATTHLLVTIFILTGIVTAAAATLGALKQGFVVFAVPAVLPGAIHFMLQDEPLALLAGSALFVFLAFTLLIALRIHRTIYFSLSKQVEVGNKLSLMEIDKIELEHKIELLKQQLHDEKNELEQLRSILRQRGTHPAPLRRAIELRDTRFASLLDELDGGVWDLNLRTGEVAFGSGWLTMLGYDEEDSNKHLEFWESILHPDDRLRVLNTLHAFAEGSVSQFTSSHRLRSKSGEWLWVMARAHGVIWGSYGELLNMVAMELHMPESGDATGRSLGLLNFDFNAWLVTREAFDQRFRQLLSTATVEGIEHALFHIRLVRAHDLPPNSSALDEICLYELGRALLNEFRHGDALLRLDNRGFALLMAFCKPQDAWDKALALQACLRSLRAEFRGKQIALTVAIGITPITTGHRDIEALMQDARSACERATSSSANLVCIQQHENPQLGASIAGKHLAQQISEGISQDRISLRLQPLQPLATGAAQRTQLTAVKACLDTASAEQHDGASLTALELDASLAVRFDIHVLGKLAAAAGKFHDANEVFLYECADTSCTDVAFSRCLLPLVASLPIPGSRLCLGIPAGTLADQRTAVMSFITQVRSAGGLVALTHFDGATSVEQLIRDCPVDFLKFDQALLQIDYLQAGHPSMDERSAPL